MMYDIDKFTVCGSSMGELLYFQLQRLILLLRAWDKNPFFAEKERVGLVLLFKVTNNLSHKANPLLNPQIGDEF